MRRYQKVMIAVLAMVLMLVGVGAAVSALPLESAAAEGENAVTPTPTPQYPTVATGKPIIVILYESYTARLTAGASDKYIVLEVLKAKKNRDGTLSYTVSNQYVYELTSQKTIMVDLSFLKASTEQYLRIHGDANPANVSEITTVNAQPAKLTIKYANGAFSAKIDKQLTVLNSVQLDKYEYKTLYGSKWASLKDYAVGTSSIAGTTLIIREKATATTPAGTEVKLKIPSAPKAPKVVLDYVKGTISLPKGVEYKVAINGRQSGWLTYLNEKKVPAAAKLTPAQLLATTTSFSAADVKAALETKGFAIIARTAAVVKDGKVTKEASQPVFVDIPAATQVKKVENENKITGSVPENYVTYTYVEKGVELTVTGGNFDYSVDQGKNWKTVKAGAKPVVAVPKNDKNEILIRESGSKEITAKDGTVTPARLPSSNSISTAWLPPLTLEATGNGVGGSGAMLLDEGSTVELILTVKQGKTTVSGATVKKTAATTLPAASGVNISGEKLTFTVPAYNENGANVYVLELEAEKTNYTSGTLKLSIQVLKK